MPPTPECEWARRACALTFRRMTSRCHRLLCFVSAACLGACGTYPCTLYDETPSVIGAATFQASRAAMPVPVPANDLLLTRAYSGCGGAAPGCTDAFGPCPRGASSCFAIGTLDFSLNFLPPRSSGSFSLEEVSALLCNLTGETPSCTPMQGSIVVRSVDLSCSGDPTTDCTWLDATLTVDRNEDAAGASLAGTLTVTDADTATSATCGGDGYGHSALGLD